jgi:general secretion pathway protein B
MSYILEALKKSEHERRLGHVPDISMLQEPAPRAPQRWQRWLLVALLLNMLILLIVAWRPWARTAAPIPTPVAAQPQSAIPAAAEPEVPSSAMREPAPLPPPVTGMPIQPPPVAADASQPVASLAPQSGSEPATAEPASGLPVDAPRWEDLPADLRGSLPVPRIDVHVFAQDPARRFVLIELRKYHEGERIDGGATIEAIRNDGIVVSYQGQRYRVDRP